MTSDVSDLTLKRKTALIKAETGSCPDMALRWALRWIDEDRYGAGQTPTTNTAP